MPADERRKRPARARRTFFRHAIGATLAGAGVLAFPPAAAAQEAPSDLDILNFALNLEISRRNSTPMPSADPAWRRTS
ncbi:hypothetical protein AB5I41_08055 [Sphingomonas sp. MMS24-JH45]